MNEQKIKKQNIDLSNALSGSVKEPETKQNSRPESEDASFPSTPKMVKAVFKLSGGKIRSERLVNYILLAFAAIIFIISLFIFYSQLVPKTLPPSFGPMNPAEQNGVLLP